MKCAHCQLDFKKEQMLEERGKFFCCTGCKKVYKLLLNDGLQDFYTRLKDKKLSPIKQLKFKEIPNLDFISTNEEGFKELFLIIEGIHCDACVWLNEKALSLKEGILEININKLTHKAKIVFDESLIGAPEILKLIQSIGYNPSPYNPLLNEKKALQTKREFYAKLIVAIACVMNVMWISVAKYAGFFSGISSEAKDILNFAEFILASPVLFYTGSSFYKAAFFSLKKAQISMDFLVIFGASLAYIYSLWAMFSRLGDVYFDSVAMIICFVFVGKYLEVLVKKRASDTMDSLSELLRGEVFVLRNGEFVATAPLNVKIGDILRLNVGDRILIDGKIISGSASLDMSSLSGENEPILASKEDNISSGGILLDGSLNYEATRLYKDSRLCQIIALLENSQSKKPRLEALCDRLSAYFSRTMLALALICFLFWLFYMNESVEISLIHAISLLIIACPCALALATPVANLIALFESLKFQLLFKQSSFIEDLGKCDFALFDKTGVLTQNKLKISEFYLDKRLNLSELFSFLSLSKHPISLSIREFLEKNYNFKKSLIDFNDFKELRAKGLKASFKDDEFLGGKSEFIKENKINLEKEFQNSHFIFAKNGEILAFFELESTLQKGALELIEYLKAQKIEILMLTGDNFKAAQKIASKLKINFKAAQSPENKMQEALKLSKKYKIFMLADGINDALALKNVAVGISLKQGSDLANESADALLLKPDLSFLKKGLKLCKKSYKIIKQNLMLSLFYNACCVPLAFFGLVNPLFAAISMSLSSTLVVMNSLRLKR